MNNRRVSVVLVGIGGYGNKYVKELLSNKYPIRLAGVVDIAPKNSLHYDELLQRNIPIYETLQDFYQEHIADLAIISTPIHLHKEQSCVAMRNGSHVLCEKPIAIDLQDIKEMKKTSAETGKFLAVGFNWSFTEAVQQLKQDILAGKFGKAKRFKSITLWPRTKEYYARSWAGKKYSPNGDMIFDSIASNATAHYIHHLLYLNGSSHEISAQIKQVNAELYKANDIETFDTCAVQITTATDLEIYYYASHAVNQVSNPRYVLEFEKATIYYHQDEKPEITVKWHDGNISTYKDSNKHPFAKLDVCLRAIINDNKKILCGIEAATPHVESVHAMHQSMAQPKEFPQHLIQHDQTANLLYVKDLDQALLQCYDQWCLPSELQIEWSKKGKDIFV